MRRLNAGDWRIFGSLRIIRVLGIRENTSDEICRIPYVRRLQKAVQDRRVCSHLLRPIFMARKVNLSTQSAVEWVNLCRVSDIGDPFPFSYDVYCTSDFYWRTPLLTWDRSFSLSFLNARVEHAKWQEKVWWKRMAEIYICIAFSWHSIL